MEKLNAGSIADIILTFKWESPIGSHKENYFGKLNVWRDLDLFPKRLQEDLLGSECGRHLSFLKGENL